MRRINNNPFSGAFYLLRGFNLILKPGMRKFIAVPLLINTILFSALIIFFFTWVEGAIETFIAGLPEWLQWLEWLLWILISVAIAVFTLFTFTLVANVISTPFNGPLAEAVERFHTKDPRLPETPWHEPITNLFPMVRDEMHKLVYSLVRSLPFLILFLIPGINFIAPVLWLIVGAWLLAVQYADYPLGNHQYTFKRQLEKLRKARWLVMGFGSAVMLVTMIPVLNFLIVPAAVAGATLMCLENFDLIN